MASAKGVRAGRAFVELGIDDKIAAGLKKVAGRFKAIGATIRKVGLGVTAFGTGMLAPLGVAAKLFADMGSEIFDASKRTGVAAEALSALGYAADQSGASLGDVETGLRKMSKLLSGVSEGSKSSADTLADLGLSMQQLKGLAPEEQFAIIGDAISRVGDATKRAALAQEVFGKSGTNLLPMLSEGAAGLKAMSDEARRFGLIISTEDAAAADMFGDSLTLIWKQMKMVTFQTGAAVAKALQPYATAVSRIIKTVIDWVKNNGRMIIGFAAAGIAITAVGGALVGLGVTIGALGFVMSGVAAVVGVIGAVLGAILSPIGLVVTALGTLGVWFVKSTTAGGNALKWLGDRFNELSDVAKDAFGGIADALASGNLGLAAKIAWASISIVWAKGVAQLKTITAGLQIFWEQTVHGMTLSWIGGISLMAKAFLGLQGFVETIISTLSGGMAKFLVGAQIEIDRIKGQKVSPEEAAQRFKDADTQTQLQHGNRQRDIDDQKAVLAAQTAAELAAAELIHQQKLKAIGEEESAGVAKAEEDLRRAKDDLAKLRGEAAKERKDVSLGGGPKLPDFDDVANAVEDVAKKIESRGTFNAAALQSLQSSPVQDRIAKNTKDTVDAIKRLNLGLA